MEPINKEKLILEKNIFIRTEIENVWLMEDLIHFLDLNSL